MGLVLGTSDAEKRAEALGHELIDAVKRGDVAAVRAAVEHGAQPCLDKEVPIPKRPRQKAPARRSRLPSRAVAHRGRPAARAGVGRGAPRRQQLPLSLAQPAPTAAPQPLRTAEASAREQYYQYPLSLAAERGHLDVVELLLDKFGDRYVNLREFVRAQPRKSRGQRTTRELVRQRRARGSTGQPPGLQAGLIDAAARRALTHPPRTLRWTCTAQQRAAAVGRGERAHGRGGCAARARRGHRGARLCASQRARF